MVSHKKIASLLVAVTIAATLYAPITDAVTGNTGEIEVENESVVAEPGTAVDLDGHTIQEGSETVEWYNSTSESYETVEEGTDYEIDTDAGTLTVLESSSTISEGDELRVGYTYAATSSMATTVINLIPLMLGLLILVVLAKPAMDAM